jgi:hypothetical protein
MLYVINYFSVPLLKTHITSSLLVFKLVPNNYVILDRHSWLFYNLTQFWHYPGESIYSLLHFRCQSEVPADTCAFNWAAVNESNSSGEPHTELTETTTYVC